MADSDSLERSVTRDDGGKRRQIMEGAWRVFLDHGFDAASMNEVARAAGVSKGTLYVYFASKEDLFEALVREEKRDQAEQTCRFDDDVDIAEALRRFGMRMMDRMMRPSTIAHLRIVAAASTKFPRIGQVYYEAGPQLGAARLEAFLRKRGSDGEVAIENHERAAFQFLELCKSRHFARAIFGVGERPADTELAAHVADAVAVFMRAYAVDR